MEQMMGDQIEGGLREQEAQYIGRAVRVSDHGERYLGCDDFDELDSQLPANAYESYTKSNVDDKYLIRLDTTPDLVHPSMLVIEKK